MSKNIAKSNRNNWVFALIASIAVNGLLGGLLLAKGIGPKDAGQNAPLQIAPVSTGPNNPRRLLRTLPPARRKQVLRAAMKQTKVAAGERPRVLMQKLRAAQRDVLQIAMTEPVDGAALTRAQTQVRELKQDLTIYSDALITEVLKQLTPEEKQAAFEALKKKQHRRPNKRRKQG